MMNDEMMAGNGWKWMSFLEMAGHGGNGWKLLEMAGNCQKLLGFAGMAGMAGMAKYVFFLILCY